MYVCVCNAVTDKQIRRAVEAGVSTMRGLHQELGVAGCCGKCGPCAREVLRESLGEMSQQGAASYCLQAA